MAGPRWPAYHYRSFCAPSELLATVGETGATMGSEACVFQAQLSRVPCHQHVDSARTVSYTHRTLPTILRVYFSGVSLHVKNKKIHR